MPHHTALRVPLPIGGLVYKQDAENKCLYPNTSIRLFITTYSPLTLTVLLQKPHCFSVLYVFERLRLRCFSQHWLPCRFATSSYVPFHTYMFGICSQIPFLNTGKGATVTFLLRSLSTLEGDENLRPFVQDGKVHLVSGDALNKEDVTRGWKTAQEASESGRIDLVLFTVGEADIQYFYVRGLTLIYRWKAPLASMERVPTFYNRPLHAIIPQSPRSSQDV